MLTSKTVLDPIPLQVAVGPELFEDSNALGVNFRIMRLFKQFAITRYGINFAYIADLGYPPAPNDPRTIFDRAQAMGVRFSMSFFFNDESPVDFLRDFLQNFDVIYCPITLQEFAPCRGYYINDRGHFISCLERLVGTMIAPSVELFRNPQLVTV